MWNVVGVIFQFIIITAHIEIGQGVLGPSQARKRDSMRLRSYFKCSRSFQRSLQL
jgi:hypothetical protein